jgi:predicted  nucleic acid-binding Zn-ribbon protein
VTNTIIACQKKLANEQQAWEEVKNDAETLAWAFEELKKMVDQLSSHVAFSEAQVKILTGNIVDVTPALQAKKLNLEHTTAAAKDCLLHQNTRLTKKLEGTGHSFGRSSPLFLFY